MKQQILKSFFHKNRSGKPKPLTCPDSMSANWIMSHGHFPYVPLMLPAVPAADMLAEAQALDHLFVPHRSNDSAGWSSLSIHGISSQHTDHYATYPEYAHLSNDQVPYDWTDVASACPVTVKYFREHFPHDVYHRVRFMKLAPGGYILPHSDSHELGLRATNICLNNPENCEFVFQDHGLVPLTEPGSAVMLANGYVHSVWNQSHQARYHMIVHGYATDQYGKFSDMLCDSFTSFVNTIP